MHDYEISLNMSLLLNVENLSCIKYHLRFKLCPKHITHFCHFEGTDFCALGNDCHDNSTCVNLATKYACQCKRGFQGNGKHCEGR